MNRAELRALIFDVDGTLAETEEAHRIAFNATFFAAGLDWHWDVDLYRRLLAVTGGRERILHYIREARPELHGHPDLPGLARALHHDKTARYVATVAGGRLALRPGVERLLGEARAAGLRLAIATTTSLENVTTLLGATLGAESVGWFEVIGAGDQVAAKKPAPDIYRWVLGELGLEGTQCLALEDSCNGVRAALGAGIPVVVTTSAYTTGEDFGGALDVVPDLDHGVDVARLRAWHGMAAPAAASGV